MLLGLQGTPYIHVSQHGLLLGLESFGKMFPDRTCQSVNSCIFLATAHYDSHPSLRFRIAHDSMHSGSAKKSLGADRQLCRVDCGQLGNPINYSSGNIRRLLLDRPQHSHQGPTEDLGLDNRTRESLSILRLQQDTDRQHDPRRSPSPYRKRSRHNRRRQCVVLS